MLKYLIMALLLAVPAFANDRLELDYQQGQRPNIDDYYEIKGTNPTTSPQIVVIRLRDRQGAPYHDRVNEERWVLPGKFHLIVQPSALQTPSNRFLDLSKLVDLNVFSPENLIFETIDLKAKTVQSYDYAFDFGPVNSPVFSGFIPITPDHPFIIAEKPESFIRKGTDSLIRDGIKGVTTFEFALPNGQWMVHLWTEDIGEWETLPPLYERRIRVNGNDVSLIRQSHEEWVQSHYLAGKRANGHTPWESFGERRGGLFQTVVDVQENKFRLELAGANVQATTITGFVLEPLDATTFTQIQRDRRDWFEKRWPHMEEQHQHQDMKDEIVVFAGETIFVPLGSQELKSVEHISVSPLFPRVSFHRTTPNSGLLVRKMRRFGHEATQIEGAFVRLNVSSKARAGLYDLGGLRVHVVDDPKPAVSKSVGIYLEEPPHIKENHLINMQVWCDLDFLKKLGLTAVAPPFSKNVVSDYQRAKAIGFRDVLAYTPMKRNIRSVLVALQTRKIDELILSIADEPSNPGQAQAIKYQSDLLQNESPFAKRAGHLNNPQDVKHLEHLDIALINSGYGVDFQHISYLKMKQKQPWLYNMEDVRLASGFYLWRTGAHGYLQWHGRMPTADPFDPTDGREDDVQMLYPNETVCSMHQEIDISLMEMVNGLSDLRWLLWLDDMAEKSIEAEILRSKIQNRIPKTWKETLALSHSHWQSLRHSIQKLALQLQN